MSDSIVSLSGIHKSFGPIRALDGASIDIPPGQISALVGDNGSGKSTLIKILSGNIRPDSGSISIEGGTYTGLSIAQASAFGIRTVYQDLSLDNHKNSYENVFLGQELMRGPFLDRRGMESETRRLLDRLEIAIPDLKVPAGSLSGGQRQGLAIARALLRPAKLLLLDEPTAAMGVRESHRTIQLLRRLKEEEGLTQLLVIHNLYQVFDVADRVLVMRSGKCIAQAMTADSSPEDIHYLILEQERRVEDI